MDRQGGRSVALTLKLRNEGCRCKLSRGELVSRDKQAKGLVGEDCATRTQDHEARACAQFVPSKLKHKVHKDLNATTQETILIG